MVDAAKKESTALTNMTGKLEFAEDNMVLNEEFKKNVAIPYFKDIYKDLVSQSDSKSKGLNKITLLNVSHCLLYSISIFILVHPTPRHNRRKTLCSARSQRQ
jgi:hypothetical protein